jgi:hypothetical protein
MEFVLGVLAVVFCISCFCIGAAIWVGMFEESFGTYLVFVALIGQAIYSNSLLTEVREKCSPIVVTETPAASTGRKVGAFLL